VKISVLCVISAFERSLT